MANQVRWGTSQQGWHVTTVRGCFLAVMRERLDGWRWVAFGNGHPLGRFDGLARAKQGAVRAAEEKGLLK